MSLYNRIAGVNDDAPILLGVLGYNMRSFERFRDIHLNADGTKIIVLTRCGGDNRADHWRMFEMMANHPYYIKDYDDDYDNTYAYIEFSIPEKYKDMCKKISTGKDPKTIREIFEEEFANMNKPGTEAYKRSEAIAQYIQSMIEAYENGDNDLKNNGTTIIKL